jgi:hypothetical protein
MERIVMSDSAHAKHGFIPFNQLEPVFFEVVLAPIHDAAGKLIPGYNSVRRLDTGDTLAVHSDKYSLVPYQTHFDAFEKAIQDSRLQWQTMEVKTDMADNGAKCFRQYLFPAHMVDLDAGPRGIRKIALSIMMTDSYDGSTRFQGRCGAYDFICMNGIISGKTIDAVGFKHTGRMEIKIENAAQQLTEAADRFLDTVGRYARWPSIELKPIEFSELVADMPQSNPRLVDQLTAQFSRNEGRTLWDAFDLLTTWSTHEIPVKTQADRQKRVAALVEGDLWVGLERVG